VSDSKSNIRLKHAVSLTEAQAIVDRIEPGTQVTNLVTLLGGEHSSVYEMERAGEAQSFIIKLYPEFLHWKLQKEDYIYGVLGKWPCLPIPRVLWRDASKTLLPLNLLVMTKINGQALVHLEASLNDAVLFDIYRQMGEVLRKFHDIGMESFGYLVTGGVSAPYLNNESYMAFEFRERVKEFRDCGGDPEFAGRLERYVASRRHLLQGCSAPIFCHNDFHIGNIMVTESADGKLQMSGVVDVENAIAGDPLFDVAKTLLYNIKENRVKRDGFLAGYGPIDRPDWEETIELYSVYHVLEGWSWIAFLGEKPSATLVRQMEKVADTIR
jgi:aminoglycoside phosphotransferase (APT) family kinase protein